jgi:predicted ATP-grasp superfamily ATP-dependent carboligase
MMAVRPLWGNGPDALARSRSPFFIAKSLRQADLPALEVRSSDVELPDEFRWLRKPVAGSAGNGIAFAGTRSGLVEPGHYFQRYIEGTPMSAVFVRAGGRVTFLGATEQLIGVPWLNAAPFRYAGNIGPIELVASAARTVERVGAVVGESCGLLGVFGVDFVLDGDTPWLVEVNPRYPASVEVLERASGTSVLAFHRSAFELPTTPDFGQSSDSICGKAIVYAASRQRLVSDLRALCQHIADVPDPGAIIEAGWPIATVLVQSKSRPDCLGQLRQLTELTMAGCIPVQ